MQRNKPLDESRKTDQTSGTKMAFYSKINKQNFRASKEYIPEFAAPWNPSRLALTPPLIKAHCRNHIWYNIYSVGT
ncbi:hypothetical protein Hanom_Chr15g01395521 [Helianthus anomalus]